MRILNALENLRDCGLVGSDASVGLTEIIQLLAGEEYQAAFAHPIYTKLPAEFRDAIKSLSLKNRDAIELRQQQRALRIVDLRRDLEAEEAIYEQVESFMSLIR